MTDTDRIKCIGCGGEFPDIDGPTHRYMESSSGCWAAFGQVLEREYSDPTYMEVHRLSVDAYAVQHTGTPCRHSIQSVGVHLIRLCLFFEHDLSPEDANDAMLVAARYKQRFVWLEPPASLGQVTVADVVRAKSVQAHKAVVKAWAKGAWAAWSPHHDTIRKWLSAQQQHAADSASRRR